VSPRTSTRSGDAGSKHSNKSKSGSPTQTSPLGKEIPQSQSQSTPNLNPSKSGTGDVKGDNHNGEGSAAIPAALGGRSTADSMPVHAPSQGFREGGQRGITKISEESEGSMEVS
jgi:hypothetical protein